MHLTTLKQIIWLKNFSLYSSLLSQYIYIYIHVICNSVLTHFKYISQRLKHVIRVKGLDYNILLITQLYYWRTHKLMCLTAPTVNYLIMSILYQKNISSWLWVRNLILIKYYTFSYQCDTRYYNYIHFVVHYLKEFTIRKIDNLSIKLFFFF